MTVDVARLPALDLATVDHLAAYQTRIDRKYVVDESVLAELAAIPGTHVLEIDGGRSFHYRSTYFDTPEHDSYFGAARRRRHRSKVRTRTYVDAGTTWLEVKRRDGRGHTVKHRIAHGGPADVLDAAGRDFVGSFETQEVAERLVPVLATTYERTTLVVPGGRVTIDRDVRCAAPDGRTARVAGVVVETKGTRAGTAADRVLWRLGHRPVPISKFGTGLAALRPDLPANKWHRTLDRHVSVDDAV